MSPTPTVPYLPLPTSSRLQLPLSLLEASRTATGVSHFLDWSYGEPSRHARRCLPLALHRPIAVLLFVLAFGICLVGVFAAAAISFPNDFLATLFIAGIVVVALLPMVAGAIIWTSKSAIVHQKVILRTDSDQHFVLICKSWTEIDPSQVRRIGLTRTNTWSIFSGLGIPGRPFIRFGKAWAIELTTLENMTTSIELPFDKPECEWICRLLEKVFLRSNSSLREH